MPRKASDIPSLRAGFRLVADATGEHGDYDRTARDIHALALGVFLGRRVAEGEAPEVVLERIRAYVATLPRDAPDSVDA